MIHTGNVKLKAHIFGMALLTSIAGTACTATEADTTAFDEQEAIQSINDTRDAFMQAMANADFGALSQIADENTLMIGPGSSEHLNMYAAAGNSLAPGYRIAITPEELVIINEEWAFERGTSVQSWQPEGDAERVSIPNSYLMILRNTDGQWRPYREVASALPPPGGWPTSAN